jgi:ligand-binding sensor domain-containing protein
MAVSGNMLAIGTVRRGLVLVNLQNHKIKFYNERNGLQNNTVLSIAFDKRNNLWLGLDNGIDYISLDTPFTTLYTYPYSSGAGYASVIYKGFLYLGTNSGVYRTSWPVRFGELSAEIEFIPQLSGQVWDLKEIDGKLFCMHDKGLYILDGKTIESVPGLRGMWTCTKSPGNPAKLWAGGYEGMYVLEKVADKWRVMIHQPMGGMQGQAADMEINYKQIMLLKNELYQIIADHSGNPFEKIEKDSDRDYWMTSQEALEYGMIDNILVRNK